MWWRPVASLGMALLAVLGLAVTPAPAATGDWSTSVLLRAAADDRLPALDSSIAATTTGTDGSTHVFLNRGAADPVIRDVVRTGGTWRTRTTPYAGSVLAATSDRTGVFVFFLDESGTFAVGRRTAAGRYVAAVRVRTVSGHVHAVAAMLAVNGAWQVFFSYSSWQGPDSPGVSSGLVTASSTSPTAVRVLRTSPAVTLDAAWLPGRVVALVIGDEASRRLTFGRGVAGRWAFGPLGPGYGAPFDAVGRDGRLHVAWIDGKDVLTRESDGRAWGPVTRVARLPGNRGAVAMDVSLGRAYVGWSSQDVALAAPVRNAALYLSERRPGGRWITTQVSRAASPELLGTTAVAGRPTLVYRLIASVPGEVRASTRSG